MKYKLITFLIFCFLSALSGSDLFSYFAKYTEALYSEKEFTHSQIAESNGWDRICGVYETLYDYRINRTAEISELEDNIEDIISSLKKDRIKSITPYEKEFLTASLYGSLAYLGSEDPSFGMLRIVNKAGKKFRKLEDMYRTVDSAFGNALTEIALGMYFENSFWIGTIFSRKGDVQEGILKLDNIAFKGEISKPESNLFLIEYYAEILKDHHSSLKYSKNLFGIYPESRYFMYLYARDLYHTGKIRTAVKIFKSVNDSLSEKFYPFDYESIIYEAKCLYLLNEKERAQDIINYAAGIHDGYLLKNLRNQWLYSLKIIQEAVFRVQNLPGASQNLSYDEKKRIMAVYYDFGYYRELKRLSGTLSKKDSDTLVLEFRTAVIMNEWERAHDIIEELESSHEKEFEENTDRNRLEILINITDNFLRNKK